MRVFIAHASEDKDDVARPLAAALRDIGVEVWYDEYSLFLGDSLPRAIDRGLSECDYGVVILSKAFFQKIWPRTELDGLVAREASSPAGTKILLPVWHAITHTEVMGYSPTLADRVAISTANGINTVVNAIQRATMAEPGDVSPWAGHPELRSRPRNPREILSKIVPEGPVLPSGGLSPEAIRIVHELVEEWERKGRISKLVRLTEPMAPERRKALFNDEKYVFLFASHGMHKVWFEVIDLTYRTIGLVSAGRKDDNQDFHKALEFFFFEMGLLETDLLRATATPVINSEGTFWVTVPYPLSI